MAEIDVKKTTGSASRQIIMIEDISKQINSFAAEEKYPNENLESTKDIVQSILNEALHSVIGNSEKVSDSNHIGDCNIAEELSQYTPLNPSRSAIYKVNEAPEEKNNQLGEKPKEYKVIQEKALTDSELRIQNCKIHLQTKGSGNAYYNIIREETCSVNKKQDRENELSDSVGKNEALCENMLPNPGQLSKEENETKELKEENLEVIRGGEKPFTPLTTEDLRQSIVKVWKNINNPVLNGLDGDLSNQPQGVMKLMEELSTLKMLPESVADPNRPRACTLVEEDVKKMIKEIGEMNFNASAPSFESIKNSPKGNDNGGENSDEKVNKNQERNLTQESRAKSGQRGSSTDGEDGVQEESIHLHENAAVPYAQSVPTFKSQKFNNSYDLEGNGAMFKMSLTESDEAFIEFSESVIQIIEPKEDSNDENEDKISFSLLNESAASHKDKDLSLDDYDQLTYGSKERLDVQELPKIRSGMTTVGPIKNADYDPKVLTGPEIDYGKMTKISGSREMRKDSATNSLSSTESKKIYIDDSDDGPVIFFENGYMEFDTILNHDIASMTKVQKVKEVLSDQPKSDENLKGEEKLLRSPLDLKDVDAYSCESYNVIDLGMQLLTIDETQSNNSRELDGNADLPLFENNIENVPNGRDQRHDSSNSTAFEEERIIVEDSQPNLEKEQEGEKMMVQKSTGKETKTDDHHQISPGFSCNKSLTQVNLNQNQKHNTISRVFQKASNRFIMKDSDSFLRNSKSLPRDTSKITNTESFKSLLDDCQTSAVGVLKKSRSLVRNTQNVLKAVSKMDFGHTISGDKKVNSGSDVAAEQADSRQSTSNKNNGFLKFKETIKNKVGKKLKSLENITSSDTAKGTGNDRDPSDSVKKPPPKSPLVCTNQLIQGCEEKKMDYEKSATVDGIAGLEEEEIRNQDSFTGEETDIEVICDVKFQGNSRCASHGSQSDSITDNLNDTNSDQIDYVVMQTVKGLDEEKVPDSLEVSRTTDADGKLTQANTGLAMKNIQNRDPTSTEEFTKSSSDKNLTKPLDRGLGDESFEEFADKEGNEVRKSISNEKLRRKNKNLSARIRSFWQTAFGKVKTSPKKDVS